MEGKAQQQNMNCHIWASFLVILLCMSSCVPVFSVRSTSNFEAGEKLSRIQKHLRRLNKPAVRSVQSPDGDIIDCVLRSQQPAFDHPSLQNHKIQVEPTFPNGHKAAVESSEVTADVSKKVTSQLWHQVGKCPAGTIPIRRVVKDDILRAKSIRDYGRKFHHPARIPPAPGVRDVLNSNGHQHAIAYVEGDNFYGAKAIINVWNPTIEVPNEFSLSQIWILSGSFTGDLNSIEAGWQVSPDLYGDNNTRLFTYWTSDAYQATGCYNLLCSGFVQINEDIAMGATISPVSDYDGRQYDISILIWKDPKEGNWWMQFGDSYVVGYWPAALFSNLAGAATMLEWGGEVVNSEPGGEHTRTEMGSGQFPSGGFGRASYFSDIQIVDAANNLRAPPNLYTFTEKPHCYDVQDGYNSDWANFFYFGGPGRNSDCP